MPYQDRERTIRLKLARMESRPTLSLPTGFRALDDALGGGGLPRGRIVEIFGPPDSGKTTLALQIVANVQRKGLNAAWVDAERTFDPAYAVSLRVAADRLPVMQPDSTENAMAMLHRLADSAAVDLLVVDSAAALVPSLELEAGIGNQSPGLHARVLASGLRTLVRLAANSDTAVVFLNQTRVRKDRSGEETETSAGGSALKLYAGIRLVLSRAANGGTRFRILKNKVAAAYSTGELSLEAGPGFSERP